MNLSCDLSFVWSDSSRRNFLSNKEVTLKNSFPFRLMAHGLNQNVFRRGDDVCKNISKSLSTLILWYHGALSAADIRMIFLLFAACLTTQRSQQDHSNDLWSLSLLSRFSCAGWIAMSKTGQALAWWELHEKGHIICLAVTLFMSCWYYLCFLSSAKFVVHVQFLIC